MAEVEERERLARLAGAVLGREDLQAYHGWIKYLAFRAEQVPPRPEAAARLTEWVDRILQNPRALSELRGVHEWAYESRADGSGQPFRISIPEGYDPAHPLPLSIYLHGMGGNHLEFSQVPQQLTAWTPSSDFIELAVLGRGRGVGYVGLGEADVLDALAYVDEHFRIQPQRVHLVGVSMGGTGVMLLAARHPDRFASAWVLCGSALDIPIRNLLRLPVYAMHGDEDRAAPELMVRGGLARLLQLGGAAVWDLASGYGHTIWKNQSGAERARKWTFAQRSQPSRQVREIDFTALDGNSARAYWVEVAEWGPRPRPARFKARVVDNGVELELQNVQRLRLDLAQSPVDISRPVSLVVGASAKRSKLRLTPAQAKGPVLIAMDSDSGAAHVEGAEPRAPFRLHTPGGPNQLYAGEPLLIVHGTQGDADSARVLKAAAEQAARSANAGWDTASPSRTPDGVPLRQNLYGALRIKPDSEVTAQDVARHHLVLIGTAEQNAVVQRIASRLPVKLSREHITLSDGSSTLAAGRAVRLVHYNPEAPERLIYWVAAQELSAYGESSPALDELTSGPGAADLLVTGGTEASLVLTRSFDSRWRWLPSDRSPLLALAENTWAAAAEHRAGLLRAATRAELALISAAPTAPGTRAFSPGVTRLADVTPYFDSLSIAQLSGRQLQQAHERLSKLAVPGQRQVVYFWPPSVLQQLEPEREYRVVLSAEGVYQLPALTQLAVPKIELTELTVAEVLDLAAAAKQHPPAR